MSIKRDRPTTRPWEETTKSDLERVEALMDEMTLEGIRWCEYDQWR